MSPDTPEPHSNPVAEESDDVPESPAAPGAAPRVFSPSFSGPGLVVGFAFFAFSLVPSLLLRTAMFQGVVSGVTMVVGYGIGASGAWLWNFLGIAPLRGRMRTIAVWVSVGLVALMTGSAMWRHVGWQNHARELFGMDPVSIFRWIPTTLSTLLVAVVILVIARAIRRLLALIVRWLDRILPARVAIVLGRFMLAIFLWVPVTGVFLDGFFAGANLLFSSRDTAMDAGVIQPTTELKSGSAEPLVAWDTLRRKGRAFVATGPSVDELNNYHGGGAVEPIRVYAGLKSADTLEARAKLVLDELIRTDAFGREVLVVATTTGTGFLDEGGVDPLEFIYNGDSAIADVQCSYLLSWISLLADQEAVKQTSQVVFDTVFAYWSTLPEESRPELCLYGRSLGSFGVESILTSVNMLNEPIDGALMVGPPFVNGLHAQIEEDRDPGSAPWRPIYQEGRTVRFTSQEYGLNIPTATWGPTKLVYLQHGSDPVVFFDQDLALTAPDWLIDDAQRSPDVSEQMVWFPLVTMWQVAADLLAAGSVPEGFGHLYPLVENAQPWIALTDPAGWTDADTTALLEFREVRQGKRDG
jgi:uncharacterized membrane protein